MNVKQRILDHFEASGDANLGQTLLRLAQLAKLRHQMSSAQGAMSMELGRMMTITEDGVEGLDSEAGLVPPRIRAEHGQGRCHREVDR